MNGDLGLVCEKCTNEVRFEAPGKLAGHLVMDHLMSPDAALRRARETFHDTAPPPSSPPPEQETPPMGRPNTSGTCGYCSAVLPRHSANCKRKPEPTDAVAAPTATPPKAATAKKRKPITKNHPRPKRAESSMLDELDALRSVAAVLDVLPDVEARARVIALAVKLFNIDLAA